MKAGRKRMKETILYFALLLVFFFYLVPILWMINSSLKSEKDNFSMPPKVLAKPTLVNYRDAFAVRRFSENFVNSVIVAIGSSVCALLLGTPAAYALSRFKMKRKEDLFFWFLSTRMAPPILAALPIFVLSRNLGIFDTRGLLVIMDTLMNLSWVVWMMRSFFDELPIEIDEACMVDGCTRVTALTKVILPLARPGMVATVIFCLVLSWNEYFFALVLTSVRAVTLPAAITSFLTIHGLLWGQMCAAGTVIMLPILFFVFIVQKQLIRGLTMGAVKN
jgi:multiple sugar transport system permease protein